MRVIVVLLALACGNSLAQLPDGQIYRGEIRRDADGKLVAVPPAANAEPLSVAPPQKQAVPNAAHKTAPAAGKPAMVTDTAGALPRTIRVGPQQQVRSISVAASMARDGDTIEIEPGDYLADVAVWKQAKLTLRGVGAARPRLIASGVSAEGKGTWVIRGGQITVENIEFRDARVADKNGAGIRFERGYLTVRNCKFENNENGILSAGKPDMYLDIENSEFGYNGAGDGRSHNIYVGEIARLRVTGSYFHHANKGHLLKSRAAENHIFYNRLSDETDGHASYELEFPNGGIAYVVGNLIEQGSQTENSNIVAFGAEGYKHASNELYLVNNTLVDDRPTNGKLLMIKPGVQKLVAMNNLLVSKNKLDPGVEGLLDNNINAGWEHFALPQRLDYRLKASASLIGKYVLPPSANGVSLVPQREYAHPAGSRPLAGTVRNPGAFQEPAR